LVPASVNSRVYSAGATSSVVLVSVLTASFQRSSNPASWPTTVLRASACARSITRVFISACGASASSAFVNCSLAPRSVVTERATNEATHASFTRSMIVSAICASLPSLDRRASSSAIIISGVSRAQASAIVCIARSASSGFVLRTASSALRINCSNAAARASIETPLIDWKRWK
jgi:hypothetical protein